MGCPSDDAILAFLDKALSPGERETLALHFDACADCRALLAAGVDGVDGDESGGAAGRYVLLATLGAGGMGVVQSAFDRELDRKVALKFLSSDLREDPARARARLQREAQALARLTHPNVVTVHDVGVLEGEVFVAMELVEGVTLRTWLASDRRSTRDVLAVMRQAGEGLAAAHAAGLVHRDFKPENVLVGDDGRVRVTDFGLARLAGGVDEAEAPEGLATPTLATLTRTGMGGGTPAYMAPEQRLGHPPSARSDLYSYCVTLHEAVTGARPGPSARASRRGSAWLERVLDRGLRESPEERWPSMRALLDVLHRGPRVTWRRAGLGLGLAVLLAIPTALAARRERGAPICARDASAFDGVWDAARRDAVHTAFRRAYPAQAELAFEAVDARLHELREEWIAMRADSCAATRVRHDQSETLLDLRTACLDAARARVAAAIDVFVASDQAVVENAVAAAGALPRAEECADVRALEAIEPVPRDPVRSALVRNAQATLAQASALVESGKEKEGLALVEPALASVKAAAYPPVEAKLLGLRAVALIEVAPDTATVEKALGEAACKAIEARDDAAAAEDWILLLWKVRGRGEEARQWSDYSEAAIRRIGGDDYLEGDRMATLGRLETDLGHLDEARRLLEQARPLIERSRGPRSTRIARIDDFLGSVAFEEARYEEALRLHRQGRRLRESIYGPEHVATLSSMFNESGDLRALGRTLEGLGVLEEIQAIAARNRLPSDGYLELTLAGVFRERGDPARALEQDRLSVAAIERAQGPKDRYLETPLSNLGLDFLELRRPAEAIAPLERAVKLMEEESTPDRASALIALARALDASRRDPARAQVLARQAEALMATAAGRYGGHYVADLADIRGWLRGRRP